MLIGFKLRNFRSFLSEQAFRYMDFADRVHGKTDDIQTGTREARKRSRIAVNFGPNASGKTNFVLALATLRNLVLHSTAYSEAQFRERYTPFQFGPSAARPTDFEVDVLLDHVRYRYTLCYDARRIRSERLLVYRTGKSQRWFERRFDEATQTDNWTPFSSSFHGSRDLWRKATRRNVPFLTTAVQLNSELLEPLYRWFESGIDILLPADIADLSRTAVRLRDVEFKARLLGLLRVLGIQVDDMRVAERDTPPAGQATIGDSPQAHSVQSGGLPHIDFLHVRPGLSPVWLDSLYEGAGTHRLLGLFGPFLDTIERGKLLVVDEFDASLHPLAARFLIQLINDPLISDRRAQLLITSHNATLMDQNILRRDEIWLTRLDQNYTSHLSPLSQSKPRRHELIAKHYLKGRYGAVPDIQTEWPVNLMSAPRKRAGGDA